MSCIYCGSEGPFDDEHVFPYALGGPSKNTEWLLENMVCAKCNRLFSKFELNFIRNTFPINFLRLIHGPRGRNDDPIEAIRCTYTDIKTGGRRIAYLTENFNWEIPPQLIIHKDQVEWSVENEDILKQLVERLVNLKDVPLTIKVINGDGERFCYNLIWTDDLNKFECFDGMIEQYANNSIILVLNNDKELTNIAHLFLDRKNDLVIICNTFDFAKVALTELIHTLSTDCDSFLSNICKAEPTIVQGVTLNIKDTINLETIARFMAKTGINFLCKIVGPEFVRNNIFEKVRDFVLGIQAYKYGDPKWPLYLGDSPIKWLTDIDSHIIAFSTRKDGYFLLMSLWGAITYGIRLSTESIPRLNVNSLLRIRHKDRTIYEVRPQELCERLDNAGY